MSIIKPYLLVLDTFTLGNVSRDFWSQSTDSHGKARRFVDDLKQQGVYVAITMTHLAELMRHDNRGVVEDRKKFLRQLPHLAWIRPIDRNWFPGCHVDVLRRELLAVIGSSDRSWTTIVEKIREDLWETGTGAEIIHDNEEFWRQIEDVWKRDSQLYAYIASIAATDPGSIGHLTIAEIKQMQTKSPDGIRRYFGELRRDMEGQLSRRGDKRLDSRGAATSFTVGMHTKVDSITAAGGDFSDRILEKFGVPKELVKPDMTVNQIGELAVFSEQLNVLGRSFSPPVTVTAKDIPIDAMPSYALERKVVHFQRKAERVSRSDLGDGHIATLVLYADGAQVDKRTYHNLEQVKRSDPDLGALMGRLIKAGNYSDIPAMLSS